ncbi:MAG: Uncharacterized protein G01um101456_309 [Parcubacteria group bacterium Gr01-1014_56]|nr:MAG: Uncharacterized protein G01um101456_309 [Parcubacteria group bacterium Gr01-1014_56]
MYKRGFTLIELLVVIAIIGILAGIVLAALGNTRQRGQVSGVGANLSGMRASAELFSQAAGTYDGFCLSTGTNGGNRAFAAAAGTVNVTAVGRIDVAGGAGLATCNDVAAGWAAEVPLPAAITPPGQFWCVDFNGFSGTTTGSTLGVATDYTCN